MSRLRRLEGHAPFGPGKVHALLVDRDDDTRLMYAEYLSHLEYEIDEAADGREALARAITLHPTVIVTDSQLPGIGGLELCHLLRTDPLTCTIPIIVITSDPRAGHEQVAEAAGASAVLFKPCLPDRLAAEIRAVIAQANAARIASHPIDAARVRPERPRAEASDRRPRRSR